MKARINNEQSYTPKDYIHIQKAFDYFLKYKDVDIQKRPKDYHKALETLDILSSILIACQMAKGGHYLQCLKYGIRTKEKCT